MADPVPKPAAPKAPLGWPHVAIVTVVMGALVLIVLIVLAKAPNPGDAAAVLGTVIPGIAAIGAAVFGIPLAYQTGQAGKQEAVDKSHEAGKADGKKEAATRIHQLLPSAGAQGLAPMGAGGGDDTVAKIREALIDLLGS